jgi:hypothetical protein
MNQLRKKLEQQDLYRYTFPLIKRCCSLKITEYHVQGTDFLIKRIQREFFSHSYNIQV